MWAGLADIARQHEQSSFLAAKLLCLSHIEEFNAR